MSKGENIFKRKDGRWEARYVKGYELSGKIKYGFCYLLEAGDQLRFTEMDGTDNLYEVTGVDTLSPTEVDAVQNSGHDLVLYTCTYSGQERVTAFCDRVDDTPLGAAEELEAE